MLANILFFRTFSPMIMGDNKWLYFFIAYLLYVHDFKFSIAGISGSVNTAVSHKMYNSVASSETAELYTIAISYAGI